MDQQKKNKQLLINNNKRARAKRERKRDSKRGERGKQKRRAIWGSLLENANL